MRTKILYFILIILLMGCSEDDGGMNNYITLISASINGSRLTNGMENAPIDLELTLVFSAALEPALFKSALSIRSATGEVPFSVSFSNANSKAIITTQLKYATAYDLRIKAGVMGVNSRRLEQPYGLSFSTSEDETIRSMPPCTDPGGCLETLHLTFNNDAADFDFYSSYPIYNEKAKWEKLTQAIIVVHGQNRNADDYFSYLTATLSNNDLEGNTVLISPWFKAPAGAGNSDLYWTSSGWREGQESDNAFRISSFAVIDSLVKQLANKERFPVLQNIIITGHSSGALFTHVYAGANKSEPLYPDIEFEYAVANSQYFYYPNNYRYNEQTQEYYLPSDCFGFNYWPLGFQNPPPYLDGFSIDEFNDQFINRRITYLLGNGTGSDAALNTTDCDATLLGPSRYQRGENMILFMNEFYPGRHAHSKVIVNDIGHDGEGMYKSSEFSSLIKQFLNK